jgi:predicted transposase/invertase (TIGR01784 family)
MQMVWTSFFTKRMVFNASKAYVVQLDKNQRYNLLQPVYGLAILDETFDHETPEFYHHYRIVNSKNTNEVIKDLEFVMIELPKFRAETWADRRMAVLWLRFLNEVEEKLSAVPDELNENEDIRRAIDMCEAGAFTEAELAAYEKYWDAIRIEKSLIYESIESRAEGLAEGLAKGEAKGRAEGEAKGRAEGRAEGEQKSLINFVINSERNGLSIQQIQAITGLGEEKIRKILCSNSDERNML